MTEAGTGIETCTGIEIALLMLEILETIRHIVPEEAVRAPDTALVHEKTAVATDIEAGAETGPTVADEMILVIGVVDEGMAPLTPGVLLDGMGVEIETRGSLAQSLERYVIYQISGAVNTGPS